VCIPALIASTFVASIPVTAEDVEVKELCRRILGFSGPPVLLTLMLDEDGLAFELDELNRDLATLRGYGTDAALSSKPVAPIE
jgi:hypothetical protein